MASAPPDKATRDKNLDDLAKKVQEWGAKEQKRLDSETKFLRAVLEGRGAKKNGTINLAASLEKLQSSVDDFVTFGAPT